MVRRIHCVVAVCTAAILSGAGTIASAADMPPAPVYKAPPPVVVNPWTIDITPYAWLPSLNGSSTVKGYTSDIDATFFGDLIHRKIPKELFGLMTSFEARNDRFAIIGDFTYLLLGAGKGAAVSRTLGSSVNANVDLDANFTTKMIIAELAGAYRDCALGRWRSRLGHRGRRLWWRPALVAASRGESRAERATARSLPRRTFTINGNRAYADSGDMTLDRSDRRPSAAPSIRAGQRIDRERRRRRLWRRQPVLLAGDRGLSMDIRQDQQHHLVGHARISCAVRRLHQGFRRYALCLRHAAARTDCRCERKVLG